MKSNKILLLIVVVVAAAGVLLYFTSDRGTIKESLRDFKVKDTAAVTKIFIAEMSGKQTLLEKQPSGTWILNQKNDVRPDAVQTLLATVHDIEVRSPVGKAAYNNVIKKIAASGIKVEVYDNAGLVKTFYVGGPTQDHLGTFMYLQNSTVPFITHIPGFDGYLTPRFSVNEADWIDKKVFRITPGNFKSLAVTDRTQPGKSYTINNNNNGTYVLLDSLGNTISGISQDKVISYLELFRSVNYEQQEQSLSSAQHDSLLKVPPFRSITVSETGNKTTRIDLWRRPITSATIHKGYDEGSPFDFDVDRMTASLNGDTSLVVVQYYSFEKLFRRINDFIVPQGNR
jgi:hypothetical protein